MNLANKLTLVRIFLVPIFTVLMLTDYYIWALAVFAFASITDFVDGQIARRMNMITDFGKFLDPLADKILTTAALIYFIELGWISAWVVIVIITREFIVSGLRMAAVSSAKKIVAAADIPGKIKAAFTMIAITVVLFIKIAFPDKDLQYLIDILMYITAGLTVWSGADYIVRYRAVFKGSK